MNWNEIEDNLPIEGKKCLVFVKRPEQMRASIEIARRYTHEPAVKDRKLDANFIIHGVVTHWCELPKEPEILKQNLNINNEYL